MNLYNQGAVCLKCGCRDTIDRYYEKGSFKSKLGMFRSEAESRDIVSESHIGRTCLNCGHEWSELPLDGELTP